MKMHPFDRFLLVFISLIFILFSLFAIGVAVSLLESSFIELFALMQPSWIYRSVVVVVAAVIILICIRLIAASGTKKAPPAPQSVMLKVTDQGQVRIALSAIDTMVQKAARGVSGVRDLASQVSVDQNQAVIIALRLTLTPDCVVPEVCANVQQTVRDYIQAHAGLPVVEIPVSVDQVGQGSAVARVE